MSEHTDEEVKSVRIRILLPGTSHLPHEASGAYRCTQRQLATTNPSRMSLSQRSRILGTTEIIISYVRDERDPLLKDLDAVRRDETSIHTHVEAVIV